VQEVVGAELVRLDALPGEFGARGARGARAYAVEPVVGRNEVPAGVADHGDVEAAQVCEDVGAVAVGVGEGGAGVVDAAVDAAAHVSGRCQWGGRCGVERGIWRD